MLENLIKFQNLRIIATRKCERFFDIFWNLTNSIVNELLVDIYLLLLYD